MEEERESERDRIRARRQAMEEEERERERDRLRARRQAMEEEERERERVREQARRRMEAMEELFTGTSTEARNFRENIRKYNSAFSFASFGAQTVQVSLIIVYM